MTVAIEGKVECDARTETAAGRWPILSLQLQNYFQIFSWQNILCAHTTWCCKVENL